MGMCISNFQISYIVAFNSDLVSTYMVYTNVNLGYIMCESYRKPWGFLEDLAEATAQMPYSHSIGTL